MGNHSPKNSFVLTLDRTDRRILDELQKDGAISNLDLAEKVGLSPSPCSRRVKALQESGIIQKTVAVLDQKAVQCVHGRISIG